MHLEESIKILTKKTNKQQKQELVLTRVPLNRLHTQRVGIVSKLKLEEYNTVFILGIPL